MPFGDMAIAESVSFMNNMEKLSELRLGGSHSPRLRLGRTSTALRQVMVIPTLLSRKTQSSTPCFEKRECLEESTMRRKVTMGGYENNCHMLSPIKQ
jgi:hypothetical protein